MIIFIFSGIFVTSHVNAQQSCVTPPLGIVSWWPGDGNTQDIVDSNPGTLVDDATFTAGKVGQGFSLDGTLDHVFVGNPSNLKFSDGFTLESWVNTDVLDEATALQPEIAAVITKWGQSALTDSYGLWIINDAGTHKAIAAVGISGSSVSGLKGGVITPGTFAHVAFTYDTTTNDEKLYVNGQLVVTRNQAGAIVPSDLNVLIGREDSSLPRLFPGIIDEVTVYDRALSQTEIQGIFDADSAGKCKPVDIIGGEIIPIESTSLLLAGAQSATWMIPVLLSGIGIGFFVVSRKS